MEMFHVPHREVLQTSIAVFILLFLTNCTPNRYTYKKRNPITFQPKYSDYHNRDKFDNLNWDRDDDALDFEERDNRNENRRVIIKRTNAPLDTNNRSSYRNNYSYNKRSKNIRKIRKTNRASAKKRKFNNRKKNYSSINRKNLKNQKKKVITYKIKKGDTLYRISRRFNVSIEEIRKFNKIHNNIIMAGMNLKIPLCQYKDAIKRKPPGNRPRFRWPLLKIIRVKRDGQDGIHAIGIMITGKYGSRVVSSASGRVEKIGRMRGFGRYVVIKHAHRYLTIYSNLEEILVSEGDMVASGRTLGMINNKNLHFQIDYKGKPKNPLHYLPKRG